MADPYLVGGAVAAFLGKDGVNKLLGPTAEYLGEGLRDVIKNRVTKVFASAERKLGADIEKEGRVPPRVLRDVVNEAGYSEDDLALEYFGGVLASSRTPLGRDDRGARVSRTIAGLSGYQLRAHYIIYNSVVSIFRSRNLSLNMRDRPKMRVFFPLGQFILAMAFSPDEIKQYDSIMRHTFFGLSAENLIEGGFQYGPGVEYYCGEEKRTAVGVVCQPSALGADIFLWAHGKGQAATDFLFSDDLLPVIDEVIVRVAGAVAAAKQG